MNVGSVGNRGRLPLSNFTKLLVKCLFSRYSIVPIVYEGAPRMCTQFFDCFLLPCIWLLPLNWLLHSLHFRPVLVPFSTVYFCVCIKITSLHSMHLGPKIFGVNLGFFRRAACKGTKKLSACVICLVVGVQNCILRRHRIEFFCR